MKPSWEKQESRTPRDLSTDKGMTGSLARDSTAMKTARLARERRMGRGWMVPDRP
jgi:hypothetical protein